MKIITLTTDFGEGLYSAQVKGRILGINPAAVVVDIAHDIEKFDILEGAFLVTEASKYFPKGTIHIAVVDPGVGGKRKPIIVETERGLFVGPDNGILSFLNPLKIIEINVGKLYEVLGERADVSTTFHARDIFGPAAAILSKGIVSAGIGKPVTELEKLFIEPPSLSSKKAEGKVLYIDSFGNIITNIKYSFEKGQKLKVTIGKKDLIASFASTFSDVPEGKAVVLRGSHGYLEIDVNKGDVSKALKAKKRDSIIVSRA